MDQKTIAILVIVVVIVAVIGGVAYWALSSGGGGGNNGGEPTGVEGANSLQFTVEVSGGETAGAYKFYGKNLGTSDMMIRVEIPLGEMEFIYIVNGVEQKAWANEGTGWVDLSASFSEQWDSWGATWQGYTDNLSSWTSGDWTYTANGATVTISDITVNPSLADSLFEQ